jgi:long-subunit acyl-CoA synthetase (AMP-forming)
MQQSTLPSIILIAAAFCRGSLAGLGWTVLSGYGLAETASLFTGNRPNDGAPGDADKAMA